MSVHEIFHSLNQPLTSLRCALELSLDQKRDVRQQHHFVEHALEEVDRVTLLVLGLREFLEAAEARRGSPAAPLHECLEEVVEDLRPVAEVKAVQLRLSCAGTIWVGMEAARLRKAIFYLMEQAVHAAPPRAEIVWTARVAGRKVVITARGWSEPAGKMESGRLRIAITKRILQTAGGSLGWNRGEMIIRMPLMAAAVLPSKAAADAGAGQSIVPR